MDLDIFLTAAKIKRKHFADMLGISTHTLRNIIKKKYDIKLRLAIEISMATSGFVAAHELLSDKSVDYLENRFEIEKKDFKEKLKGV